MRRFRAWLLRLSGLFGRQRRDRELAAELESHLQMHIAENLEAGMTLGQARRDALIKLGGIEAAKEAYRDQRGIPWLETWLQDVRYGVRMLRKDSRFAAVVVLTLALGIGINTAVFSLVSAVMLRPPPYPDPDRLVEITVSRNAYPGAFDRLGQLEILAWQKYNQVLSHLGVYHVQSCTMTGVDEAEQVNVADVSTGFLPALAVQPALGRVFSAQEDKPGGSPFVILTYGFWQRRFGGDTNIIGQALTIDAKSLTIVGVLPSSFESPTKFWAQDDPWDLLRPLGLDEKGHGWLSALARLKPGVTMAQAATSLDVLYQAHYERKDWYEGKVVLLPLQEYLPVEIRRSLLTYQGAVGFVLLIACVNVANLLLARGARRQKEIAVRVTLGAGRLRIIRQLLTESVLLALLGSALGLVLAWALANRVRLLLPDLKYVSLVGLDGRVFAFALVAATLIGVFCGLALAFEASRVSLNESLKESARSVSGSRQQHRLRSALVIAEVALALVLLVGAGLLFKCFVHFQGVDPGFRRDRLLTMRIDLTWNKYNRAPKWIAYYQKVIEELRSLPEVEAVGADLTLPFAHEYRMSTTVEIDGTTNQVNLGIVNPDHFRALGIPVKKGRCFTEQDRAGAPVVVMVNESFVRHFLAGKEPVGQRLRAPYSYGENQAEDWKTIVGVVGDVRVEALTEEPVPRLYLCYLQHGNDSMCLALRSRGEPMAMALAARARIRSVDPDQVVSHVMTMEQCLSESLVSQRNNMWLSGTLGALALVLAVVGIYGVLSFLAAQRTHEIGVRMALGAQVRDVLRLVVGQGLRLIVIGVATGLAAAAGLTRLLSSFLFGVSPLDPAIFSGTAVVLAATAFLACYLPARRAANVNPMAALRYE